MKISDLVNKVEPFRFEYDGFILEGEFWKYRTTTPTYQRQLKKLTDEAETDDARERVGYKWLSDAIKSWNALGENDQPLPPTSETFDSLPTPFIIEFGTYLAGLREGNPPNSPASQTG